jgi:hypothetical protein
MSGVICLSFKEEYMKWSDVVNCIQLAAPTIGSLFGPAGTVIGAGVGAGIKVVATALGVAPTQDAIAQAVATDPAAAEKLREFEIANATELQKLIITSETSVILAVNQTMQTEGKSEKWPQYSWRPFWGFASGLAFLMVCVAVCWLGYEAIANKDATALGNIPLIIGAFSTLFAIPGAILGIASWKRGNMQIEDKRACS